MPDRTRPIRKEICLNKQELNLIQHKMRQLGTHNFGAYARKMLIDGYIIKVDYTEQKKFKAKMSYADKLGVPYVVFLGDDEIAGNVVACKDMASGQQTTLPFDETLGLIRRGLDARNAGTVIVEK